MNDTTPPHDGSAESEPAEAPAPRRLRRSADKTIGGVAAGIAEYFGIDPTLVRLGLVALVFAGGPLWWIFGWGPSLGFLVPLGLIAIAVALLVDRDEPATVRPTAAGSPSSEGNEAPVGSALAPYEAVRAVEVEAPEPVKAPIVTLLALTGIVVFVGGAALGDLAGFWQLDLVAGFAIAALVVGAALLVSAFVGRAVALVPLGVLLVVGLLAATALDPIISDEVGQRKYRVDTLVELQER
ncbi:MAG: PspC domain-containing protein [Actinomycetota bacterium]|jgi:phage shock protein C|nr:PspC domain-containing protein [Actinomycetota bacterium]